jgi:hypothetical protein
MSIQPKIVLELGLETSRVLFSADTKNQYSTNLAIGLQNIVPGPFNSTPPTAYELEQAIETVENAAIPLANFVSPNTLLNVKILSDNALDIAGVSHLISSETPTPLENLEAAFQDLAASAQARRPVAENTLVQPACAAALVIVREFMHHLQLQGAVREEINFPRRLVIKNRH